MRQNSEPSEMFEIDGDDLTLLGGFSRTSGLYHFPRGDVCPYTGADDVERCRLPRTGKLWLWTAVNVAPPGYTGPVPYGFGVVDLDLVGLRVVGRLTEADPARLHEGERVRVVADRLGDVTTWAFQPASAS